MAQLTQEYLRDRIKAQLGYPATKVELEDNQIEYFIEDAVAEASPFISERFFKETQGPIVDMTDLEVNTVINVFKAPYSSFDGGEVDVFRAFQVTNLGIPKQEDIYLARAQIAQWEEAKAEDWKYINGKLYLYNYYGKVTIEYTKDVSLTSITTAKWQQWVKNYAIALCKEALGRIRGKHKLSNIPVTNDGEAILAEGLAEKEALKQLLIEQGEGLFLVEK